MEDQEQVVEQVQEDSVNQPEVEIDFEAELNKLRSEVNGLNRRNSELDKLVKEKNSAIEEAKKATMAEEERKEYELKQRENEIAAKEHEIVKYSNREKASKYMSENDIDLSVLDVLPLDDWETAQSKLEIMKSVIENTRAKTIEEYKTKGGHVPAPGGGDVNKSILSREDLKTMSSEEISKAVDEGRVGGIGSKR